MAIETEAGSENPGGDLARMLAGQRMFLESVYSLIRHLEADVTKRGWDLVRNRGYGMTRNGGGRGLASFGSGDWVMSQVGIAFVPAGRASLERGATNTQVPPEGLEIVAFQVRWLDKSPEEPVVWYAKLLVEPAGTAKLKKWEEYQGIMFNKLGPESRGARSGNIKPGRASISGAAIVFTGTYGEVPVVDLESQDDVVSLLIEPALAR